MTRDHGSHGVPDDFRDESREDLGDDFRDHDAAYVLGALSSDDRRAYEAHLAACPACAASVRQLAGLPGLLATVPREIAEGEPVEPPPDTMLPALVRQVRREQLRRRWVGALVAAAAAVALVVAGLSLWNPSAQPSPTAQTAGPVPTATVGERAMSPVATSDMQAKVALVGVAWGTRLELTCSYVDAAEYAASAGPAAYVLVVRDRAGREEQVAHWRALPGRTMRVMGASAISVSDIASVEVQSAEGTPLLELRT